MFVSPFEASTKPCCIKMAPLFEVVLLKLDGHILNFLTLFFLVPADDINC